MSIGIKKLFKSGINVPQVLYKSTHCLILEYIHGDLVNDLAEKEDLGTWIEELARWMANLHDIKRGEMSLLKSDSNLRNFIFNGIKIYGLDFEEMKYGDPREDLGDICFFFIDQFSLINRFKKKSCLKGS